MTYQHAARRAARAIPQRLKALRGCLLLGACAEQMGAEQVRCPGCSGTGWLERSEMELCPVCRGFEEVPGTLALWFLRRVRRLLSPPPPASCSASPRGVRCGRIAEVTYSVSDQDLSDTA